MKLSTLTKPELIEWAGKTIYSRGEQYFNSGQITNYHDEQNEIIAKVKGSYGKYVVKINEKRNEMNANCNCPYDGYPCKHIVAVLLKYLFENKTSNPTAQNNNTQQALLNTLNTLNKEQLIQFALKAVQRYPQLHKELLLESPITEEGQLVKTLIKEIDSIEFSLNYEYDDDSDGYYSDDDDANSEAIEHFYELLEKSAAIPQNIHSQVYWHLANTILAEINEDYIDADEWLDIIQQALTLVIESNNQYNHELRADIIQQLGEYILDENYFAEDCYLFALQLCREPSDYVILIELLKLNPKEHKKYLIELYQKIDDQMQLFALLTQELNNDKDYGQLIDFWLAQNNYSQALHIALQGMQKVESYKDNIYHFLHNHYVKTQAANELLKLLQNKIYTQNRFNLLDDESYLWLLNYYQKQQDINQLSVLFSSVLLNINCMTLDIYQVIESVLPEEAKNNVAQLIMNKLIESTTKEYGITSKKEVLIELYAYQKKLPELYQAVSSHFKLFVRYYDLLAVNYHSQYIQSYQKEIESAIGFRTRSQYQIAVNLLLSLRTIYLDYVNSIEWQNYLQDLKQRYFRLRALHDELKQVGL